MSKGSISLGMLVALLMFSVFVDIIQAIIDLLELIDVTIITTPAVNAAIDLVAGYIFYMWFKVLGVNFKNKGVLISFLGGMILDFIPFVDSFAWTADVLMVYVTSRAAKRKSV